jgi:hypothetical protein
MVAAKSTVTYLQNMMPGQTDAWYQRIAAEITAGRMPLPTVDPIPAPTPLEIQTAPEPEVLPNPINPARQRFLNSEPRQEASPQVSEPAPKAKPKSKTKQLKQGTYKAKKSAPTTVASPQTKHAQGVRSSTEHELYCLTKDRRVAFRLVSHIQLNNPNKSEQWCWEKAIYDLERDRGR